MPPCLGLRQLLFTASRADPIGLTPVGVDLMRIVTQADSREPRGYPPSLNRSPASEQP